MVVKLKFHLLALPVMPFVSSAVLLEGNLLDLQPSYGPSFRGKCHKFCIFVTRRPGRKRAYSVLLWIRATEKAVLTLTTICQTCSVQVYLCGHKPGSRQHNYFLDHSACFLVPSVLASLFIFKQEFSGQIKVHRLINIKARITLSCQLHTILARSLHSESVLNNMEEGKTMSTLLVVVAVLSNASVLVVLTGTVRSSHH